MHARPRLHRYLIFRESLFPGWAASSRLLLPAILTVYTGGREGGRAVGGDYLQCLETKLSIALVYLLAIAFAIARYVRT